MIASRSSIERRCSWIEKQSSPVMRWHSTTSGIVRASSGILWSWRAFGRTRTMTPIGKPIARGRPRPGSR